MGNYEIDHSLELYGQLPTARFSFAQVREFADSVGPYWQAQSELIQLNVKTPSSGNKVLSADPMHPVTITFLCATNMTVHRAWYEIMKGGSYTAYIHGGKPAAPTQIESTVTIYSQKVNADANRFDFRVRSEKIDNAQLDFMGTMNLTFFFEYRPA